MDLYEKCAYNHTYIKAFIECKKQHTHIHTVQVFALRENYLVFVTIIKCKNNYS